jgi:transposase
LSCLVAALEQLHEQIQPYLAPYEEAMKLLVSIPAVGEVSAASILGEIGADMSYFPSAEHLASWAGLCPGNRQSGGKRLSGKMNKGNARRNRCFGGSRLGAFAYER